MAEHPPKQALQGPVQQGQGQVQSTVRESLIPLAGEDPAQLFVAEIMSIADELGILDTSVQDPTVGDAAEVLGEGEGAPEPMRGEVDAAFREGLPPKMVRRWDAAVRFGESNGASRQETLI